MPKKCLLSSDSKWLGRGICSRSADTVHDVPWIDGATDERTEAEDGDGTREYEWKLKRRPGKRDQDRKLTRPAMSPDTNNNNPKP